MKIRDRIKRFERIPASKLLPNPKNWRTHPAAQRDALRAVLTEIGYAGAALAYERPDGGLMLIDGHMRAEEDPQGMIPCLVLDVTESEADTLIATLDPMSALAESDKGKLGLLLTNLSTADGALARMLDELAAVAEFERAPHDNGVDAKCVYPLSPVLNERYEYVLIFCRTETEWAALQTKFGLHDEQGYTSAGVAVGHVVPFQKFLELWEHRGDADHHPQPQARTDDHGAQGDPRGRDLRSAKPVRSVSGRKPGRRNRSAS
jgi:hypothetical protein